LNERHQRSDSHDAFEDVAAGVPDRQCNRKRAHQFDGGEEHRIVKHRPQVCVAVFDVDAVVFPVLSFFAAVQLDGGHSGDVFLRETVQPRNLEPDIAVRFAYFFTEQEGAIDQQGKNAERHQSERPVDCEHEHDNPNNDEYVRKDGDKAGREHFVQDFDVAGDARHQAADRIAVEKGRCKPL